MVDFGVKLGLGRHFDERSLLYSILRTIWRWGCERRLPSRSGPMTGEQYRRYPKSLTMRQVSVDARD